MDKRGASRPKFDLAYVALFFGALVVISAMGLFMQKALADAGHRLHVEIAVSAVAKP